MKTEYMLKLSDYGWLQKGGCTAPKNTKKNWQKRIKIHVLYWVLDENTLFIFDPQNILPTTRQKCPFLAFNLSYKMLIFLGTWRCFICKSLQDTQNWLPSKIENWTWTYGRIPCEILHGTQNRVCFKIYPQLSQISNFTLPPSLGNWGILTFKTQYAC